MRIAKMKYGYEGANLSELINNYKIEGDKIVVTFLDKSTFEVAFTEGTEKVLLEEMLKQAYDRNASDEIWQAQKRKRRAIMWIIYEAILGSLAGVLSYFNKDEHQTLNMIFFGANGILIAMNGIDYKIQKSEIEELEKYSIYLAIKDKIEKTPSSALFSGIKNKERSITINTLDNFTLSDIKKIEKNVDRFQILTSGTKTKLDMQGPTLSYKNTRQQF